MASNAGNGAPFRAQADALDIEAQAKRRLADEYDAAQARGEIRGAGKPKSSRSEELSGAADVGLTHKEIHEARQIRDAEARDPGVVRRTVDVAVIGSWRLARKPARKPYCFSGTSSLPTSERFVTIPPAPASARNAAASLPSCPASKTVG